MTIKPEVHHYSEPSLEAKRLAAAAYLRSRGKLVSEGAKASWGIPERAMKIAKGQQ